MLEQHQLQTWLSRNCKLICCQSMDRSGDSFNFCAALYDGAHLTMIEKHSIFMQRPPQMLSANHCSFETPGSTNLGLYYYHIHHRLPLLTVRFLCFIPNFSNAISFRVLFFFFFFFLLDYCIFLFLSYSSFMCFVFPVFSLLWYHLISLFNNFHLAIALILHNNTLTIST